MQFQEYAHIPERWLGDVEGLLTLCDQEFYPPLSSRGSTTQADLLSASNVSEGVRDYFRGIIRQHAILVIDGGRVVAFMSFQKDYVCEHISTEYLPNLYITTVIVHPEYRHCGIARRMYERLMKHYPKRYIFTRTWSTNGSHIRILLEKGFHEHCVLYNDRGNDVDTNYYRYAPRKLRWRQYVQQYRLSGNFLFCGLLFVVTAAFLLVWLFTEDGISHELALAIATSLMASLLCLVSDTFLKIRESKNDTYINTLKGYGIANLQFNKNEILERLIPRCRKEIWISGYRLVMTGKATFRSALVTACRRSRHLHIRLLATPPWTQAYRLVYGTEDVTLNYLNVLRSLVACVESQGTTLEVRFSEKPLFSDTYKVDDRFITGPYLHCADKYNQRITAKDFFSFDITAPDSELYALFHSDYTTLWREAETALDVAAFSRQIQGIGDFSALSAEERTALLRRCCVPVEETAEIH